MLKSYNSFRLTQTAYPPRGDQPEAIDKLSYGVSQRPGLQTLLGVTGSGKTFTIANVIAKSKKNTLVLSHNKTLAAQLYAEFKEYFPNNNVGYFVSFYDYYQPESYIPQSDTYIEKDTEVNEKIEKMRLEATSMLMSGEPTIVVSTVSCIYSLGSPSEWNENSLMISVGMQIKRNALVRRLIDSRYERNDLSLTPGTFRVKGDIVDVIPAYSDDVVRISLDGDQVESISIHNHLTMRKLRDMFSVTVFPAKHYIVSEDARSTAVQSIEQELESWLPKLPGELERQRLNSRTTYDLEMIRELGYCSGIENYSRHFDGRSPGQPPYCLLDFFGDDFLLVIDESHVSLPQLRGMYAGDFTRKKTLVEHGFRLPSAFDNRPLKYEEFQKYMKNVVFVSATPSETETQQSWQVVEQVVRPTGLVDPKIIVRPTQDQISDLIREVTIRVARNQRTLVTTLTKRMAEDLAEFLARKEIKVRYMHSEIDGLQRTDLLRRLRLQEFDVLVGINLLREGLDIPEVSLVAILDADKEGFLRNATSLIQTFGRAARNIDGTVIMYADTITKSMESAISETDRRRAKQIEFNSKHGIVPQSIVKAIPIPVDEIVEAKDYAISNTASMTKTELTKLSIEIETAMKKYAEDLDFENAIKYRDKLNRIKQTLGEMNLE
ncbi:excinuclease ABC subunit UvrB [Nitrososphaera sp. AFS]|uniref:excinuclease ABC subunit UvrB n=1 Tax=Nitrososphaera sp. AFS TaxID=2301191 RepID=UPI00351ABC1E|nr:excinuclease ABC subunit UvrB [Nitrososphaera sp. AFS]